MAIYLFLSDYWSADLHFVTIDLVLAGEVALITLHRPRLFLPVYDLLVWDFLKATAAVQPDADIRVVIFFGSGGGFSAGADFCVWGASWKGSNDALIRGYLPFFLNIFDMP
jgi:Enoyl-CoA hydratase/carnithine racemase